MKRWPPFARLAPLLAGFACTAPETDAQPERWAAEPPPETDFPTHIESLPTRLELGVEYSVVTYGELYVHPANGLGRFITADGATLWLSTSSKRLAPYHARRVRVEGTLWTCGDERRHLHPAEIELLPGEVETQSVPPPPRVHGVTQLAELRSPWMQVVGATVLQTDRVALFQLEDGDLIAVQTEGSTGLVPGIRMSLTLVNEGPPYPIVATCEGEHDRCSLPEFGRVATFDAETCARIRDLGLDK
ncbi:MAG: hypothetical protein HC927_05680 [Deltaproteobacteria bacterium]|nr:hypothetical protein [Deltaproteobacteria bacterium]